MRKALAIASLLIPVLVTGPARGDALEVPSIASDAWLRTGPSASASQIVGLPRGTAVLEMTDESTAFKARGNRWVEVHVLDGRAAGRKGWVWGEFVACCTSHEWMDLIDDAPVPASQAAIPLPRPQRD